MFNGEIKRDEKGRYILDSFEATNNYIIGRKEKKWLRYKNHEYLFKSETINYEMYAELIASELASQCSLPVAKYDLAIYNGKIGVVTPSFLRHGEIINSGRQYLEDAKEIAIQNNLDISFSINSIDNILMALSIKENLNSIDFEVMLMRLIELWCFDLAILESDRNSTNWGIIKSYAGIKLSPIYDCSNMAKLNTNINDSINNLYFSSQLAALVDSIGYSLKYDNDINGNFYIDFEKVCESYTDVVEDILYRLERMDIDKAIKDIEDRTNSEMENPTFEVPSIVGIWLNKLIKDRLTTMRYIFDKVKNNRKCKIK